MFSLEETTTWTAEDVLVRIRLSIPTTWKLNWSFDGGWYHASLLDSEGGTQWSGEHPDQKFLFLDILGWLTVRDHKVKHPAWKPREQEVPLYRPPVPSTSGIPDPPDLDPDEVDVVYKTSR